jgi:hypothetical protein
MGMKTKLSLVVLGACALLAGCLPSVFPLFTEKEIMFEPLLVGVWKEDGEKKDTWAFEAAEEGKNYKLIHTDEEGRTAEFVAQLGKLEGKLFLDIAVNDLRDAKEKLNGIAAASLIQGHLFFRVWQIEPELKLNFFNSDRLAEMLEQDPKLLAHRGNKKDGVVLLASTAELQAFFGKHADNKELFGGNDGEGLKRRSPAPDKKKTKP